jgi:hypothetical protein
MPQPDVQPTRQMLQQWRREILADVRQHGRRILAQVRAETPRRTGYLRSRGLKFKTGWDSSGPYARITVRGLRRTRDPDTKEVTSTFRYGFALQQRTDFLGRGLQKTPKR